MARLYHQPHSGRRFLMATAANTSATPSQPRSPRILFSIDTSVCSDSRGARQPRQRSESTDFAVRNSPNVMKLR